MPQVQLYCSAYIIMLHCSHIIKLELTTCVYDILCRPSESEQLCPPSPSAAAAASLHGSSAGTHVSVPVSTQWCQLCLRWSDKRVLKPSHSVERERERAKNNLKPKHVTETVMSPGVDWFIIKLEKRILCTYISFLFYRMVLRNFAPLLNSSILRYFPWGLL